MKAVFEEYGTFIVEVICAMGIVGVFAIMLKGFETMGNYISTIVMSA